MGASNQVTKVPFLGYLQQRSAFAQCQRIRSQRQSDSAGFILRVAMETVKVNPLASASHEPLEINFGQQ
jgi:hypothetical protein